LQIGHTGDATCLAVAIWVTHAVLFVGSSADSGMMVSAMVLLPLIWSPILRKAPPLWLRHFVGEWVMVS